MEKFDWFDTLMLTLGISTVAMAIMSFIIFVVSIVFSR